jgi:nitrogen regulatory protein PII
MQIMAISKITAFIQTARLRAVEQCLLERDVPGFSCFDVKGRGQYSNSFSSDGMTNHTCLELFIAEGRAREVAEAIMDAAHTGNAGDGIIAIEKIDALYKIASRYVWDDEAK